MKKYILKIVWFLLLVLIFVIGFYHLNNYLFDKVHHKFFTSREIDTIILGDSHFMHLSENAMENTINMAQAADPYPVMYFKLQEALNYTSPKTIVLTYSYNNIAYFSDVKYNNFSELVINRLYSIESFYSLYSRSQRKKIALSIFMRKLFTPNIDFLNYFLSDKKVASLPFYEYKASGALKKPKQKGKLNFDKSKLKERVNSHYKYKKSEKKLGVVSISYLKKIIALCEENDIKVMLVNMPLHSSYRNHIPKFYKNKYNALTKSLTTEHSNVIFKDFSDFFDERNEFFSDPDHVNKWGALIISKKIK